MKRSLFTVTCVLTLSLNVTAYGQDDKASRPEWTKTYGEKETRERFDNPPMFYAPHAFWFWDDVIKDDKFAASMAEEMTRKGLNPGYAHPRSGFDSRVASLPIEQYLSDTWLDSFGNALEAAGSEGFTLGYCDDYDWPSGQAAGRVLREHPELEATYLFPERHMVKGNSVVEYKSVDFALAGKMSGGLLDSATLRVIGEGGNIKWKAPSGEWMVYTYAIKKHRGVDGGRVNYIDSRLMDVFIPMVHEKYDERFKDKMGKDIPGVFVDNEGDYGWKMAWSESLATRYGEKKGRDIRTWLPLLTEKDKDGLFVVARCDWFDAVSDVYMECYFEPLVKWLKDRNMYYISNLWEESLQLETIAVGDLMKITRGVTMPGNDCLEMKSQDVHDFKEVQSVAEFENRPFMSEIMGVSGWTQTPDMMKMTINSITSFGVSHVVPHGIYMNRKLETIPFPSDWFNENPYWEYLRQWTDFSRRASFVTRQSEVVADVLLVQPKETVWAFSENYFSEEEGVKDTPWDHRVNEADSLYAAAMRKLNMANIDFLVADRHYLSMGNVRKSGDGAIITINGHDFKSIVLPPSHIMSREAFRKIVDFAKLGGNVILLGATPSGSTEKGMYDKVITRQSNALRRMTNVVDLALSEDKTGSMVETINRNVRPQIRLENAGRLYTAQRKIGDTRLYWLANNTDTLKRFSAWLRDGDGRAEIWDCETGEIKGIASAKDKGYNKVSLTLNPYEGYWVALDPGKEAITSQRTDTEPKEVELKAKWKIIYPEGSVVSKATAKVAYSDNLSKETPSSGAGQPGWEYLNRQEYENDERRYRHWEMNVPVGAKSVKVPSYMLGKGISIDNTAMTVTDTLIILPQKSKRLFFTLERGDVKSHVEPFTFTVGPAEGLEMVSWYDYGLQQYSGFLEYETSITVEEGQAPAYIDLGKVRYMAEVFVNGESIGSRL